MAGEARNLDCVNKGELFPSVMSGVCMFRRQKRKAFKDLAAEYERHGYIECGEPVLNDD